MAKTPVGKAAPVEPRQMAEARTGDGLKVRATRLGYYNHGRRREGDVFVIRSEKDFSPAWMAYVHAREPERVSTSQQEIRRQHDEIRAARAGVELAAVDDATGSGNPLRV